MNNTKHKLRKVQKNWTLRGRQVILFAKTTVENCPRQVHTKQQTHIKTITPLWLKQSIERMRSA